MKRISKKTRDEAILICSIAASTPDAWNYLVVAHGLGASRSAVELSSDAWRAVYGLRHALPEQTTRQMDAAAECLLRDGWSPGDPVEVL